MVGEKEETREQERDKPRGEITHFDGIKMSVFPSLSREIAHLHSRISLHPLLTAYREYSHRILYQILRIVDYSYYCILNNIYK